MYSGHIVVFRTVVEVRRCEPVVELRAALGPAGSGSVDQPVDRRANCLLIASNWNVAESFGRTHVEDDRIGRVPWVVAKRSIVPLDQHLIPTMTKMPGDDAGNLDCARGIGIGGVEDALAREWRDCLDQRGDVAGG